MLIRTVAALWPVRRLGTGDLPDRVRALQRVAAVDDELLAGDVVGLDQVRDGAHDVLGRRRAARARCAPAGARAIASSLPSGSSTGPGATAQTRTSGANARASERVSCASAALAAACGANSGQASSAATSVMLTITPASPIARRAACAQKNPPVSVAPMRVGEERRLDVHADRWGRSRRTRRARGRRGRRAPSAASSHGAPGLIAVGQVGGEWRGRPRRPPRAPPPSTSASAAEWW